MYISVIAWAIAKTLYIKGAFTKPGLWTGLDWTGLWTHSFSLHELKEKYSNCITGLCPRLRLNSLNVNQILLFMHGVILLISAHIEKAPMTCFSSLYSFILRFYQLLIVSGCVNLVWRGRSFVAWCFDYR